jgi:hypothetical protein
VTVRFVADENFNRAILVGLRRRAEHIDVVRIQDVGLRTALTRWSCSRQPTTAECW